ncbi:hypothetical protein [Vibrio casei]|uniref:hypothetical protein n=1 Tax=Vibrio casei TaxID=673372 RepID=UPI003F95BC18
MTPLQKRKLDRMMLSPTFKSINNDNIDLIVVEFKNGESCTIDNFGRVIWSNTKPT